MRGRITTVVDRFRQPEYTGENRCRPCTVVNVLLAVGVAVGTTLVARVRVPPELAITAGIVAFLAALAVIYLRGYLVPGTPRLTRTYLPEPVLRAFGKAPSGAAPDAGRLVDDPDADADSLDPAAVLREHDPDGDLRESGVIVDGGPRPRLDDAVREEYAAELASLRAEDGEPLRRALGRELGADPESVVVREGRTDTAATLPLGRDPDAMVAAVVDGRQAAEWVSRAALLADLAAAAALRSAVPGWDARDRADRDDVYYGLRAFLDACPECDGALGVEDRVIEECCGGGTARFAVLECAACGARIAEYARDDD